MNNKGFFRIISSKKTAGHHIQHFIKRLCSKAFKDSFECLAYGNQRYIDFRTEKNHRMFVSRKTNRPLQQANSHKLPHDCSIEEDFLITFITELNIYLYHFNLKL
jgi:hypothetical protein